jgi:uncharacterized glyoxalase superfamily protein PhnB
LDGGGLVTTDSRWTPDGSAGLGHAMQIRVDDVDAIQARALAAGATEDMAPRDFEYGERQASLTDPWGHRWTISQTIADVDPASWGGVVGELD